jgi:hypothetical protein
MDFLPLTGTDYAPRMTITIKEEWHDPDQKAKGAKKNRKRCGLVCDWIAGVIGSVIGITTLIYGFIYAENNYGLAEQGAIIGECNTKISEWNALLAYHNYCRVCLK